MEMTGEVRIPANRQQVWDALNDADVLRACIPGCDELVKSADDAFSATVTIKVGPVKAKFEGAVTLSDIDPPNGYVISGEGKGGAVGFAKGSANVRLADDGDETVLSYTVDASVGGKLAQLGSRLIDATARKLAGEFFTCFSEQVSAAAPAAETAADTAEAAEPEAAPPAAEAPPAPPAPAPAPDGLPATSAGGLPTWTWVIGLIVITSELE